MTTDEPVFAIVLTIQDSSQTGEARRLAATMSLRLGFGESDRSHLALIVSELASNLVKYAPGGMLILQPRGESVDVLSLDRGPGMADVARCLEDGYSTAGSMGNGLGAVARSATDFAIYSRPGDGTAILARVRSKSASTPAPREMSLGGVCVPVQGETQCGDAWSHDFRDGIVRVIVADGLGHGPNAAAASTAAIKAFHATRGTTPAETIPIIHEAIKATRGAAVAIAEIDPAQGRLRYAGVGNISGVILQAGTRALSLVSMGGTVGHEMRRVQNFDYPWTAGATLVMHSDGLISHWKHDGYPGILFKAPSLLAGLLFRDFTRGRDDVTVVVGRFPIEGER